MRDGWEIKKLGEIGTLITGSTPSTKDDNNYSSKDYCFVKPSDISNETISLIRETEAYISEKAYLKSRKLPRGSVLTTCIGIIGKVGILKVDATCNQQINGIIPNDNCITPEFLAYSLISRKSFLQGIANAPVVPIINKKEFSDVSIPVPPLPEQEKIVSELDCLSGIIEKKRQQLKELDALAQSIFYEMFGNPVDNEKGWEVKKLGEVCKTTSGGTPSKGHNEYYEGGNIPWLRSGEVDKMKIVETELFITELGLQNSSAKWFPKDTVVIAMYGATVGQVGILCREMTTNQAICGIFPNDNFSPVYLYHFLLSKKQEYLEIASGGAQANISQNIIRDTFVCVPPMEYQQSFAQKIEAIEQQKALIKQSIAEVETLFNARMQEYFE